MNHFITDHIDIWTAAQTPKTNGGRGNGNGNGSKPYGIQKLRELILELAVRGKLVPQNPSDEPASVLLEKIAKEKKRLIKEGRIKKEKPLPEIGEDEKPFEMPQGWKLTRLGNIINLVSGQHLKPQKYLEKKEEGMIPYLTGPAEFGNRFPSPTRFTREKRAIAVKGDILLTCKGSGVGKVNFAESEIAISRQLMSVQPILVSSDFIKLVLQGLNGILREKIVGIAIPGISREDVTEAITKLPPLQEQQRIVAKVDELMALCDRLEQQQTASNETHQSLVETLLATLTRAAGPDEFAQAWQRIADHFDTLFTTEQSIEQLKQTILQLAVMGRLVPQDPNDEPTSVLLEKIAKEKKRMIKEGKIKKGKPLPKIADDEKPFELPHGWEWGRLSDLFAIITDGDHQPPPKADSGIPFLVISNLNTGRIIFDNCKYVLPEYYEKLDWTRKPVEGDILYTVTGSFGIPVSVITSECFCVQRHVAILKATHSTPREYLQLLLCSRYAFEYATRVATGIAQKTVPLSGLRNMPIPVAPESEQSRIVAKVNELLTLCDKLKARLTAAQTLQVQLADAIVENQIL